MRHRAPILVLTLTLPSAKFSESYIINFGRNDSVINDYT